VGKMKIAQVCHRYYPKIGGIETHVREISERLSKKHDVEVICADFLRESVVNGVKIKGFKSISPNNAYFFSPQIYFYLRISDFDLVHAHNYHAFPAFFASMAKGERKFVFTPHYHGMGSNLLRDLLHKPYKIIGSKIFKRADKIICVSDFERSLIQSKFNLKDNEKITVIPNGVNAEEIKRPEPFNFDGDLILYVGRLEKYKNIHLVIEAMEFLPGKYFYIIGEGGYKAELEKLIHRLNLGNRIKILNNVSDNEKYRWMRTCSLFINLSSIEAFGITVIEALAAEKPVIVNEECGLRELAEKFNGVFPVAAKEVSAAQLAGIMEERIGENVRVDLSEYDRNNVAEKVEKVYEEIK